MASYIDQSHFPYQVFEDIAGTYDGNNTAFSTRWIPIPSTFVLTQAPDGLTLLAGTDYTLSGRTLTLTVAPATGGNLHATYQTNG